MSNLDSLLYFTTHLAVVGILPTPTCLFGYVGLGPGPEFMPYFFALLSFVGAASIAVLQWPLAVLLRYRSKLRQRARPEPHKHAERLHEAQHDLTEAGR
jgi:hypothetical protein